MSGRPVPWASWAEWHEVRENLWSDDPHRQQAGLDQVGAWRLRGSKLPLGVDATTHLLEARRADYEWQQAVAAAGAAPLGQQGAGGWGLPPPASGELPLRLRYSLPLVRLVNGISDSQQRGRVASSVAVLSDAAGLPRALVDVRHEATHNELPSLPLLRAAADSALAWLRDNYWEGQCRALRDAADRIGGLLAALADSWRAAAAAGLSGGAGGDVADEDDEDDEGGDSEAGAAASGYSGAEGQRLRRQALSELRSLVPAGFTAELVGPLLGCAPLHPPPPPHLLQPHSHPQLRAQAQRLQQQGPGGADRARIQQQQQQQQPALELAWRSAMRQLLKWYPRLRALALQVAVQRLAPAGPRCSEYGCTAGRGAAASGPEPAAPDATPCGAAAAACWVLRMLPAGAVAPPEPQDDEGTAPGGPGSGAPGGASGKGAAGGRNAPAAGQGAAATAPRKGGAAADPQDPDGPLPLQQLEALLAAALAAAAEWRAMPQAGAGEAAEGDTCAAQRLWLKEVTDVLQRAVVAATQGGAGARRKARKAAAAAAASAAAASGASGGAGAGGSGMAMLLLELADLAGAGAEPSWEAGEQPATVPPEGVASSLRGAKRQREEGPQHTADDDGEEGGKPGATGAAPAVAGAETRQGPVGARWWRCASWSRCAIGCLPCPLNPNGRLPMLGVAPQPPLPHHPHPHPDGHGGPQDDWRRGAGGYAEGPGGESDGPQAWGQPHTSIGAGGDGGDGDAGAGCAGGDMAADDSPPDYFARFAGSGEPEEGPDVAEGGGAGALGGAAGAEGSTLGPGAGSGSGPGGGRAGGLFGALLQQPGLGMHTSGSQKPPSEAAGVGFLL